MVKHTYNVPINLYVLSNFLEYSLYLSYPKKIEKKIQDLIFELNSIIFKTPKELEPLDIIDENFLCVRTFKNINHK